MKKAFWFLWYTIGPVALVVAAGLLIGLVFWKPYEITDDHAEEYLDYVVENYDIYELIDRYETTWGEDAVVEYITDKYDIDDMIGVYVDRYDWNVLNDQEYLANLDVLFEDLSYYGNCEAYGQLAQIAESAGYSPSVFFGRYCFDTKEKVVHSTNHEHFYKIPYEQMAFWYRHLSFYELNEIIKEENSNMGPYGFCRQCFKDYDTPEE